MGKHNSLEAELTRAQLCEHANSDNLTFSPILAEMEILSTLFKSPDLKGKIAPA